MFSSAGNGSTLFQTGCAILHASYNEGAFLLLHTLTGGHQDLVVHLLVGVQ